MAGSCAGIPKGALPDLPWPEVIPPPKCPSITLIVDEQGRKFYQFSEADVLAIAKHREELAGEVLKGREGMQTYRRLLEECLKR